MRRSKKAITLMKQRLARISSSAQTIAGWGIAICLGLLVPLMAFSLPIARGLACGLIGLLALLFIAREGWKAIDSCDQIEPLYRRRATSASLLAVILAMWTIMTAPSQVLPLIVITVLVGALHWWTLRSTSKWIAIGEAPPKRMGTFEFAKEVISLGRKIGENITARHDAIRPEKRGDG